MENPSNPTTITTDVIKKICVNLGYYRNPICNEKLYLHHKGFDSIEEDAFDPYTDVKVLWLESNAFTHIPCGKDSLPSQKQKESQQKQSHVEVKEEGCTMMKVLTSGYSKSEQLERNKRSAHVDCCADLATDPPWTSSQVGAIRREGKIDITPDVGDANSKDNDNNNNTNITSKAIPHAKPVESTTVSGPTTTRVGGVKKDVFQSLYPTLRQIFLHNNALREMPDLSGFERLDTVNLSNNCIHSVRVNCPAFNEKVLQFEVLLQAKTHALIANSKSMQNELRARRELLKKAASEEQEPRNIPEREENTHEGVDAGHKTASSMSPSEETTTTTATTVALRNEAEKEKEKKTVDGSGSDLHLDLEMWRQRLSAYADFCPHEPLDSAENGKLSDNVPPHHRNLCSSVRSLNLSSNFIASAADVVELLCLKNLAVLDLSNNQLSNGEAVLLLLERLPRLRSLKLSGNPLVRTLPRYRKTVLARCSGLVHLDDRPVFEDERRLVTAWVRGGDEAENKERAIMKEEAEKQHIKRLEEFRAMVNRSRNSANSNNSNNNNNNNNANANENNRRDITLIAAAARERAAITRTGISTRTGNVHTSGNGNGCNDEDDDDVTSSENDEDEYYDEIDASQSTSTANQTREMPVPTDGRPRVLSSNTRTQAGEDQEQRLMRFLEDDEDDGNIYVPSRTP